MTSRDSDGTFEEKSSTNSEIFAKSKWSSSHPLFSASSSTPTLRKLPRNSEVLPFWSLATETVEAVEAEKVGMEVGDAAVEGDEAASQETPVAPTHPFREPSALFFSKNKLCHRSFWDSSNAEGKRPLQRKVSSVSFSRFCFCSFFGRAPSSLLLSAPFDLLAFESPVVSPSSPFTASVFVSFPSDSEVLLEEREAARSASAFFFSSLSFNVVLWISEREREREKK